MYCRCRQAREGDLGGWQTGADHVLRWGLFDNQLQSQSFTQPLMIRIINLWERRHNCICSYVEYILVTLGTRYFSRLISRSLSSA